MLINDILPGVKKIKSMWPAAFIPMGWDLIKIVSVFTSRYLGYNLYLDKSAGSILVELGGFNLRVLIPASLPSIQQMGLLKVLGESPSTFNRSWAGITAYAAFLFLGGLLTAGYLGLLKDGIRNRSVRLKTFFQFSWYYGPRMFLILALESLGLTLLGVFGDGGWLKMLEAFLGLLFMLTPYIVVMEDYGVVEAVVAAPAILLKHIGRFSSILVEVAVISTVSSAAFVSLGGRAWIPAVAVWPFIGTVLVYDIMLFFHNVAMKDPLDERPREYLRGYGQSFLKTLIIFLALIVIAGLPTALSKSRYFGALLPWHKPVIQKQGYVYQTGGGLVLSRNNNLSRAKIIIDTLSPRPDDILYTKPGVIRGKGRLITAFKPIYFTFELTRIPTEKEVVYGLQNGGKVEATDGIWGNPVERGMILVIGGGLDRLSGVIYDKRDYSEFNTLWSPDKDSIFLGPTGNKKDLYGFYAAGKLPPTPVEFQWIYNKAVPVPAEGEKDPLHIMQKLNVAFESLDLDMLLNMMYYVNDLKPQNVLEILEKRFSRIRWNMKAKGLQNWEDNVRSDVSYYQASAEKIVVLGDYYYLRDKLGFRAEIYKIGGRWKITKMVIE
ncbi:hypothetical protein [Thermoanaerobacterium sp. DL9XJH110]|uniref:hypothetical protein n=1 Tax=Thermoanaerobacterium sp. DL9XJH110 TaxID=3386643 RepID=UPI003BB5832C